MICFDDGEHRFQVRAAAVCVEDGHVLIHRSIHDSFWSLPGGRVEMYEASKDGVVRELREEIGVDATATDLLWLTEHFYTFIRRDFHEICMYYKVDLQPGHPYADKTKVYSGIEPDDPLEYRWHPVSDLANVELYPEFLRTELSNLPNYTVHYVIHELEERK